MSKISAADAQQLYYECAVMLKEASDEILHLRGELERYRKRDKAVKIAQQMQERGLAPDWGRTPEQAVRHMEEMQPEELSRLEELVSMTSPHNPLSAFDGDSEMPNHDTSIPDVAHPFVQHLLGHDT